VAGRQHRGCIMPQAVTHSLVLLKIGKIITRNVLSCLEFINKPLLLLLFGCLYYLYQWYTVKHISNNDIYLLIKYIKSILWRVAKRLSYIEDARCLKVKHCRHFVLTDIRHIRCHSHFHWFDHPILCWRVQIMTFLIIRFPTSFSYFLPPGPRYRPYSEKTAACIFPFIETLEMKVHSPLLVGHSGRQLTTWRQLLYKFHTSRHAAVSWNVINYVKLCSNCDLPQVVLHVN